jgi:hypothetical protein
MERIDEAGDTQEESSRRRAWPVRWARVQRGQAAGQSRKWPQGWFGQKPGEDDRGTAQRPTPPAGTAEEVVNSVIALICARYGEAAIGRGNHGIRYHSHP